MKTVTPFEGYAITRGAGSPIADVTAILNGPWAASVLWICIREKSVPDRDLLPDLRRIRDMIGARRLVVSGRADLATLSGADGVQIPAAGPSCSDVRSVDRALLCIRSVHTLEEAQDASVEGADLVLVSPVFPTPSKTGMMESLGIAAARALAAKAGAPAFFLGGITASRVGELRDAGMTRIAGIRLFLGAG